MTIKHIRFTWGTSYQYMFKQNQFRRVHNKPEIGDQAAKIIKSNKPRMRGMWAAEYRFQIGMGQVSIA